MAFPPPLNPLSQVTALFNPGEEAVCWGQISTGEPDSSRVAKAEGGAGVVAAADLPASAALVQLSYEQVRQHF